MDIAKKFTEYCATSLNIRKGGYITPEEKQRARKRNCKKKHKK